LRIAVIGTGISGMAAAWLLSRRHEVTVFEREARIGGHSNTVEVATPEGPVPVDTGFIVYNPSTYPNLTALFEHLCVGTRESEMSFAVSRRGGRLEYAGTSLASLFAQRRNALSPAFWSMLADLRRFYRDAPVEIGGAGGASMTLGGYLESKGYGRAFRDDHLLPMAAAIWSAPAHTMLQCPAQAFVRFFENHGLLKLRDRPVWRTVAGGSRAYVERLTRRYASRIRMRTRVVGVTRAADSVVVADEQGTKTLVDHVVIATHADEALSLLRDADARERRVLGGFRYTRNRAVLHSDASFMPRRRGVWSSWNYVHTGADDGGSAHVTYWMNRLQELPVATPLFVTLNAQAAPRQPLYAETYTHPVFDVAAFEAQRELWSLQGRRNTWFCGAYFGAGFHEDGLQAGLAVAEDLGGVRRPWSVPGESARIFRAKHQVPAHQMEPA
jgi:predicted NAD/FAD-binding protein